MDKKSFYNLSKYTLVKILDSLYNEIYVTDESMKILYVNQRCKRHYGLNPNEMIGHNHMEFYGKYWFPSVLPLTHREKKTMCIEQSTITGEKIISTTTPVYNDNNKIKMVVSVVQESLDVLDMNINPDTDGENHLIKRNASSKFIDIITHCPCMKHLLTLSKKSAKSDIPILIEGDSGTGKTMLAEYIHKNSSRSNNPFFSINCAAIPENLLESELFGYEPYAFTGSNSKGKIGLIELANNGTLFLDEIGELATPLQAKLLNVVENNQFIPVGGNQIKNVNVRIISATNKKLEDLVCQKKFREDLFWRLNIINLKIPSLIDRKKDIIPLSNYYLNIYNKKYKTNKLFSQKVLDALLAYNWPGNVRQLKNTIERTFVVSNKPKITLNDLPEVIINKASDASNKPNTFRSKLESYEKDYIIKMFYKYNSSRKMASALDISQSKANRLINKYCKNA